jgi:hypothetical protein
MVNRLRVDPTTQGATGGPVSRVRDTFVAPGTPGVESTGPANLSKSIERGIAAIGAILGPRIQARQDAEEARAKAFGSSKRVDDQVKAAIEALGPNPSPVDTMRVWEEALEADGIASPRATFVALEGKGRHFARSALGSILTDAESGAFVALDGSGMEEMERRIADALEKTLPDEYLQHDAAVTGFETQAMSMISTIRQTAELKHRNQVRDEEANVATGDLVLGVGDGAGYQDLGTVPDEGLIQVLKDIRALHDDVIIGQGVPWSEAHASAVETAYRLQGDADHKERFLERLELVAFGDGISWSGRMSGDMAETLSRLRVQLEKDQRDEAEQNGRLADRALQVFSHQIQAEAEEGGRGQPLAQMDAGIEAGALAAMERIEGDPNNAAMLDALTPAQRQDMVADNQDRARRSLLKQRVDTRATMDSEILLNMGLIAGDPEASQDDLRALQSMLEGSAAKTEGLSIIEGTVAADVVRRNAPNTKKIVFDLAKDAQSVGLDREYAELQAGVNERYRTLATDATLDEATAFRAHTKIESDVLEMASQFREKVAARLAKAEERNRIVDDSEAPIQERKEAARLNASEGLDPDAGRTNEMLLIVEATIKEASDRVIRKFEDEINEGLATSPEFTDNTNDSKQTSHRKKLKDEAVEFVEAEMIRRGVAHSTHALRIADDARAWTEERILKIFPDAYQDLPTAAVRMFNKSEKALRFAAREPAKFDDAFEKISGDVLDLVYGPRDVDETLAEIVRGVAGGGVKPQESGETLAQYLATAVDRTESRAATAAILMAAPHFVAPDLSRVEGVAYRGSPSDVMDSLRRASLQRGEIESLVEELEAWDGKTKKVADVLDLGDGKDLTVVYHPKQRVVVTDTPLGKAVAPAGYSNPARVEVIVRASVPDDLILSGALLLPPGVDPTKIPLDRKRQLLGASEGTDDNVVERMFIQTRDRGRRYLE